jgi:hypothetical protein
MVFAIYVAISARQGITLQKKVVINLAMIGGKNMGIMKLMTRLTNEL